MSNSARSDLVNAIGFAISRWQDSVEDFDGAVGEMYDLSAPERRCLGSISHGPQPANVIARDTNLSPAAVTTLIDRLEKRGFVKRQLDPADRRKVMVAAAEKTEQLVARAYHPIFQAGAAILEQYSSDEMRLILKFIAALETMQTEQAALLRSSAVGGQA